MLSKEEIHTRRHDARRREMAERLLPVVEELIGARGGFSNVTIAEILDASGLPRTTFYRHFTDKTDLLMAVAEPALQVIFEAAVRPWESGADLTLARFQREMRITTDTYLPHVALLHAMSEAAAYDERVRTQYRDGFGDVQRRIGEYLAEGQAEGYIRNDIHAEETAGWITWMAERGMGQLLDVAPDDGAHQRLVESLASFVWYAVYADRER